MKNKDSILNLTLRLVIITLCAGLILGLVYGITKAPIQKQTDDAEKEARLLVLPDAQDFEEIKLENLSLDEEVFGTIQSVFKGTTDGEIAGYTLAIITKAYAPNLSMTVGIDADGVITGVNIGSHEETPGLGANAVKPEFLEQFTGTSGALTVSKQSGGNENEIQALTGATITSKGVANAVNLAREFFELYLKEGA